VSDEWSQTLSSPVDAWDALAQWCASRGRRNDLPKAHQAGQPVYELAGPTGEQNLYQQLPPRAVLCVATQEDDLVTQLAAVLAVGSHAVWDGNNAVAASLYQTLPASVQEHITLTRDLDQADF